METSICIIIYIPRTRTKLRNLHHTDFPYSLWDPNGFTKEFNLAVKTCDPGYSYLFQLIYLLVSGNKATELLRRVCWESPVGKSAFIVESQVTLIRIIGN